MQATPTKAPATQRTARNITQVAVLGSGVMGSRIACHFANIGVNVLLLDIVPRELTEKEQAKGLSLEDEAVRNRIVNDALQTAIKGKPSPLYRKEAATLIRTGNFDDNLAEIAECDWVLEAIVERLDIKQQVFEKVDALRKKGTIVTSNTSGIPIHLMAEGRSDDFRAHFMGTHFFNPPRYLRLLEVIPGPDTDPELVEWMMHYGDVFLGKQTVLAKDSPAFIANRVGLYAMARTFQLVDEMDLSIEEVDLLAGPSTGKPKSGVFRLSDIVGLDTTVKVLKGVYDNAPDDESREIFKTPKYVDFLMEKSWFGDKSGQGFYKKSRDAEGNRIILSLDLNTQEYRAKQKPAIPSLKATKGMSSLQDRMQHYFYEADDKGGEFVRRGNLGLFAYAANRIPQIADHLYQIDDAIRAGFGWDKGPFELWDMAGLEKSWDMFETEGLKLPEWVSEMKEAGHTSFYKTEKGRRYYYDIEAKDYQAVPGGDSLILLDNYRDEHTIWSNDDSSVIDLGDGVLNVEFHSKMNSLGEGVLRGIHHAIDYAEKHGYNGVVVANDGQNFTVGANLGLIGMMAMGQEWDMLAQAVHTFQQTAMRIRTSAIPVVFAPHSMCLGGGCEFTMHSDKVVAAAETYIGLVEVGVGLIPGGGGTKEMAVRAADIFSQPGGIGVGAIQDVLMNIATAKVSTSAEEARGLHYLRDIDDIVVNGQRRIMEAKQAVLEIAEDGYTPPVERKDVPVLGINTLATLYAGIEAMRFGHYASEHDVKIAKKIAFVLCGGDLTGEDNKVSEQYLLDIEREQFLSLLGEQKTLMRIQNMLTTGKPLRN